MRRSIKWWLLWFWYRLLGLAAVAVILLALVFSAARLLFPLVPSYKQDIEHFAAGLMQRPVTIGQISTDWKWFRPRIKLLDVSIGDADEARTVLVAEQVILGVNLVASIANRTVDVDDIVILGSELELHRDRDGKVFVQNVPIYSGSPIGAQRIAIPPVLQNRALRLLDVDVDYSDDMLGVQYQLTSVNVSVRLAPGKLAAYFDLGLPQALGQRAELGIELVGDLNEPNALLGELFIRAVDLDLAQIGERLGYQEYLHGGQASFDVWVKLDAGRQYKSVGRFDLTEPTIRVSTQKPVKVWKTDRVIFDSYVETNADSIKLGLKNVSLAGDPEQHGEDDRMDFGFVTARAKQQRFKQNTLAINFLRLEQIFELAEYFPSVKTQLQNHHINGINGTVNNIYISWDQAQPAMAALATATFSDLKITGHAQTPSLDSLSGSLRLQNNIAEIKLQAPKLVIDYPHLFRQPLPPANIEGVLQLKFTDQGWTISARDLGVETEHMHARQWFDLELIPKKSPFLNAYALCSSSDASATPRYLPAGKLSEKSLEWLDQAFVSGVAVNGEFEMRGPVKKYPFRNGEGVFRIEFDTVGNEVSFWPPGPNARNVRAHVRFLGPSMSIMAHELTILNTTVHNAEVQVDDLRDSRMQVHAHSYGSVDDALNYVKQSRLRDTFAGVADQVTGSGQQVLELNMSLPIHQEQDSARFALSGYWDQGALSFNDWGIHFTEFNPQFRITESNIDIDQLPVKFNGQDVSASADGSDENNRRIFNFRLDGNLSIGDLLQGWKLPIAANFDGRSNVSAQLKLPLAAGAEQSADLQLLIKSNLIGTGIQLPPPIGKRSEAEFVSEANVFFSRSKVDTFFKYSKRLRGAVRFDLQEPARGVTRANLRFNGPMPTLPHKDEIWISGEIPDVDLDKWVELPVLNQGSGHVAERLTDVDVIVDRFTYLRRTLSNLRLRVNQQPDNWRINLDAAIAQGQVLLPKRGFESRGLAFNIDYADIDQINQGFKGEHPKPSEVPPFQLTAKRLKLSGWDLHDVSALVEPVNQSLMIHNLRIQDPAVGLQGQGEWSLDRKGHHTELQLKFDSQNVGLGMTRFGFSEMIKGGKGTADLDLHWDDAPSGFSFDLLEGETVLSLNDGQILEIEPGGGRIFGLLSLQTIPRRLALDFSDLFSKGYRFDKMRGQFKFAGGNAFTEDYFIEGPTGRIDISGRIGLVQRDYDQQILFRPDLSSSLPLVGVLLGGSTGGWAVVLADRVARLFGKQADDLAQIRYTLTGSWEEPVFTRVRSKASKDEKAENGKTKRSKSSKSDQQTIDDDDQRTKS